MITGYTRPDGSIVIEVEPAAIDYERWADELAAYLRKHPSKMDIYWRVGGLTGAQLAADEQQRLAALVRERLK